MNCFFHIVALLSILSSGFMAQGIELSVRWLVGEEFFVSVKHRNHLGVMTHSAITLTTAGTVVDFTTATAAEVYNTLGVFDGAEQVTINGVQALWAGNAFVDNKVKCQLPGTDIGTVLVDVLTHPLNASLTYNFNNAFGYNAEDVNLDGQVKYQGIRNDIS